MTPAQESKTMSVFATSNKVADYNATESALQELRARLVGVAYDVTTTKGMAVAKTDRAEVKGLRVALEAKRKEIKLPALEFARMIDSEAARITAELRLLEDPIDAEIKAEESRKELERVEREKKEADRKSLIARRLVALSGYVGFAREQKTSNDIAAFIAEIEADEFLDFDEFTDEALLTKKQVLDQLLTIMQEKSAAEEALAAAAEANRVEAERLAAERVELEAHRAAAAAADAAAKTERDRIEAEAAKLKKQQDDLAEAQNKLERERVAAAAEVTAKAERERLDAIATAARVAADAAAAAERARLDAAAAAKAEAERIASEERAARLKREDEELARNNALCAAAPRMFGIMREWRFYEQTPNAMVAILADRNAVLKELGA